MVKKTKKNKKNTEDTPLETTSSESKSDIIILPENPSPELLNEIINKVAEKEREIISKIELEKEEKDIGLISTIAIDTNKKRVPQNIPNQQKEFTPEQKKELLEQRQKFIDEQKKTWLWANIPGVTNNDVIFHGIDDANINYTLSRSLTAKELEDRKKKFFAVLSEVREYNLTWSMYGDTNNSAIGLISPQIFFRKNLSSRKYWANLFDTVLQTEGLKITSFVDIIPTDVSYCYIVCYEPELLHAIDSLVGNARKKEYEAYIKEYLKYDENNDTDDNIRLLY